MLYSVYLYIAYSHCLLTLPFVYDTGSILWVFLTPRLGNQKKEFKFWIMDFGSYKELILKSKRKKGLFAMSLLQSKVPYPYFTEVEFMNIQFL